MYGNTKRVLSYDILDILGHAKFLPIKNDLKIILPNVIILDQTEIKLQNKTGRYKIRILYKELNLTVYMYSFLLVPEGTVCAQCGSEKCHFRKGLRDGKRISQENEG